VRKDDDRAWETRPGRQERSDKIAHSKLRCPWSYWGDDSVLRRVAHAWGSREQGST